MEFLFGGGLTKLLFSTHHVPFFERHHLLCQEHWPVLPVFDCGLCELFPCSVYHGFSFFRLSCLQQCCSSRAAGQMRSKDQVEPNRTSSWVWLPFVSILSLCLFFWMKSRFSAAICFLHISCAKFRNLRKKKRKKQCSTMEEKTRSVFGTRTLFPDLDRTGQRACKSVITKPKNAILRCYKSFRCEVALRYEHNCFLVQHGNQCTFRFWMLCSRLLSQVLWYHSVASNMTKNRIQRGERTHPPLVHNYVHWVSVCKFLGLCNFLLCTYDES